MAVRPRLLTTHPRLVGSIDRPRLVDTTASAPLVAITAPAGSGATTAAAQIATSRSVPMAWCRLARGFDRAADVVAMVTGVDETERSGNTVELADRLLDDLDREPRTVVVDDLHLAADAEVERLLAECVALLPDGAGIVVTATVRPAGLLGLVPRHDVVVLDGAALAFTDDEAVALFERAGHTATDALRWRGAVRGWALGLASGSLDPASDAGVQVADMLTKATEDQPALASLVDHASVLPYVSDSLLAALGVTVAVGPGGGGVAEVAAASMLLTDHGGLVEIDPDVGRRRAEGLDAAWIDATRRAAATELARDDPTTAIDLLLDVGDAEAAADVLADHLSEIGVERALTWLYRLPDELRRRFPPVLAAGRATVEVDSALAAAMARVEVAADPRARREALLALGSVEQLRGELSAAAGAYEAALRAGAGDADFVARVSVELAATRWSLGDVVGTRAALAAADDTPAVRWLRTQAAVLSGSPAALDAAVDTAVDNEIDGRHDGFDLAAAALVAAATGARDAGDLADRAYTVAIESGGEVLAAAAPIKAWTLLRAGNPDEALVVADELERRLGPAHRLGRVHGAIVRARVSAGSVDHERDLRRLRDLRRTGYAPVERLAAIVLDGADGGVDDDQLELAVLGRHEVVVDGRRVRRSDWKSKKALEVLTVLVLDGARRREQVIETVWPDRPAEKGRTLLRTALSEIRRVLEPDRATGEPSRHLVVEEDRVGVVGTSDLARAEARLDSDPRAAFTPLGAGLAPEVEAFDWSTELASRVDRAAMFAAARVAADDSGNAEYRVVAFERLIAGEPWQRSHYDALANLHRSLGDEPAAAEVERRWFADD